MKTVTLENGEVVQFTDTDFENEKLRRFKVWNNLQVQLASLKDQEMEARKQVVAFAFDQEKQTGTERIDLPNGYVAKCVKKINWGWVKSGEHVDRAAINAALDTIEKTGADGALIADRLVKWSPTLSQTEYKLLSPQLKAVIDSVIVTTEGSPTLEVIPPKAG